MIACIGGGTLKDYLREVIYPIGSVYIINTNTNPSTKFGGTWQLIDKEFKSQFIDSTGVNGNDATKKTNCSTMRTWAVLNGHTVSMALHFKPSVNLGDTLVEIGTINYNRIGISKTSLNYNGLLGYSDSGQGIAEIQLSSSGLVETVDTVNKFNNTNNYIASGQEIRLDFSITLLAAEMIDSFCDKFYWRRTA